MSEQSSEAAACNGAGEHVGDEPLQEHRRAVRQVEQGGRGVVWPDLIATGAPPPLTLPLCPHSPQADPRISAANPAELMQNVRQMLVADGHLQPSR